MCIYFYRFTYNHQKVRVDKGDFWDNFSVLCPNYTADAQNIRANTDLSLTVSVFCPSSGYSVMSHYSLWYTGLLLHSFISILTLKLFIHKLCHGTLETLLYSRQSMFPHLLGVWLGPVITWVNVTLANVTHAEAFPGLTWFACDHHEQCALGATTPSAWAPEGRHRNRPDQTHSLKQSFHLTWNN